MPFRVPVPVDQWAKDVFRNFKAVESTLSKHLAMTEQKRAELHNWRNLNRDWTVGVRVWRHPTMRSVTKFQRSVGPHELRAVNGRRVMLLSEDGTLVSSRVKHPAGGAGSCSCEVFEDSADFECRSLGEIVGVRCRRPCRAHLGFIPSCCGAGGAHRWQGSEDIA